MKKNRLILIVLYIVVLSVMVVSLSACGLFNKKDKSDQPTITAFYVQKASYNYEGSKEEAFNSATTLDVCVDDNETYNLVVKYNNKSKYSISYIKINGERYNPASFATGSNTSVTYIPFKTAEQADTEDIPYTLSAVYFVDGTSTTKMSWSKDVDKTSTVIVRVRPEFNVTLNYMNQDFRVATATDGAVVQTTKSYYNSDFSNILQSPIYETGTGMPVKEGGWIFVGWFTKPNGEGTLISEKEKYYFWTNMTFYAHYERMYELEVVELDEPIEYTYGNSRKVFSSGVKVVNHTFDDEWSKYQALVIPDTVTIESTTYTTTYDEYNVPVFKPTTTSVEYPVIAIDNNAFRAFNTIVTVSIGRYIESIGYCAFQDCTGMTTFNFPSNTTVKYIGDYAFEKTSALGVSPPFTLPETVEYLGNFAFRYSGWATTRNAGSSSAGESVLHIKSNWKYVGYKCFFNTNFETVIFDPGCYFSGQISSSEGSALESASGYRQFQKESNLIGASLFADCLKLRNVQFKSDKDVENALNIIPDACFDLFSWTSNATKIQYVAFSEGLKYIGSKAFYYQQAIEKLELPASLEEIDTFAFYECEKVNTLTFGDDATHDSQLQILHSSCFGNLIDLDSCTITSSVFARYGSGIFRGCDRLKCVIFENLEVAPTGYRANEVMENGKDVEVVPYHYQADFLYATGEAGDAGSDDGTTYSSPLRVFCKSELVNEFKEELLLGKEVHAGSTSSNTSAFSSSVFVHPLENIVEYTYMYDGTEYTVDVAYQEVYAADANGKATTTVLGYSLVYWGARSDYVVLPEASDLNTNKDVFEIAMFSMPTSVQYIYVPSSYTRIEHDAFNGCQVLSNVEFEDINTLEYIGDYAFFGTAISSFTAGTNLKVIGQYAFSRCNALQWVDLYESQIHSVKDTEGKIDGTSYTTVRTIYVYKYEYELSDNDKDYSDFLGNSCFAQDANLLWVRLPQDIKQLSTGLFNGCRNMTEVIIPTDVISSETSASSDYTFYQYGTPASIYNAQTMHSLTLYVSTDAMNTHKIVYSEGTYSVISSWNDPRSNN